MNNIKKYKIKLTNKSNIYTSYRIDGLKAIYYKNECGNLEIYNGRCGLIRSKKYNGYAFLCSTKHTNNSSGYVVEFNPLYNEYDQMILIEYNHDDVYTFISMDSKAYLSPKTTCNDCLIVFSNSGILENFNF